VLADSAFQAGQIVGLLILVAVGVGIARTFSRSDLSWREKLIGGKKKDSTHEQ
jgi:hypothetical protein